MEKVKNKFESSTVFSNTSILNKAANLSFFELLGNPELINQEVASYRKVSYKMVSGSSRKISDPFKLQYYLLQINQNGLIMNNLQRIQPPVFPVEKVIIPEAKSFRLNNGVPVYLIDAGTEDIMRLEFVFRAGQVKKPYLCSLQHPI